MVGRPPRVGVRRRPAPSLERAQHPGAGAAPLRALVGPRPSRHADARHAAGEPRSWHCLGARGALLAPGLQRRDVAHQRRTCHHSPTWLAHAALPSAAPPPVLGGAARGAAPGGSGRGRRLGMASDGADRAGGGVRRRLPALHRVVSGRRLQRQRLPDHLMAERQSAAHLARRLAAGSERRGGARGLAAARRPERRREPDGHPGTAPAAGTRRSVGAERRWERCSIWRRRRSAQQASAWSP